MRTKILCLIWLNMKNKNKFHSKKIVVDGISFDSKKESKRWLDLLQLEKEGKIQNLQKQVKFELIPSQYITIDGKKKCVERSCFYIADFVYFQDGKQVVEDVKGYKKGSAYNIFTIKRKLMLEKYGIRIKES